MVNRSERGGSGSIFFIGIRFVGNHSLWYNLFSGDIGLGMSHISKDYVILFGLV